MSDDDPISLAIECEVLGPGVEALRARGREAMNELSVWVVEVVATAGPLPLDDLVGAPVTLVLADPMDDATRAIGLIATEVAFEHESADGLVYALTLAPPEWLLTLRSGYRIFLEKTAPEILKQLLLDAGTPAQRVILRLSGAYALRRHTAQYDEVDWGFVERLCAEEGISYWFDATDAGPVIVFGDDPGSHDGLEGAATVPFHDASGLARPRAFDEIEVAEEVVHEAVSVRDYDVRHPDVLLEGSAGAGDLHWYEYPARVLDAAGATERARVRLEQLRRFRVRATARGDSTRLRPGHVVAIVGCADADLDAEHVIVAVEHRWSRPSRATGDAGGYRSEAVLVPRGGPPHRPAPPARRPRIAGVEPAITTGAAGEEIHVNDLGELKVRFLWDRSGIGDERSSTWVRCLQMGLGGAMLLPRVGWEVPVAYYEGDPDRPLVLGRVYNAEGVAPYGLPGAKATTALQSATSPGGATTNELRMADDAGRMELFLHASRDQSVHVGGSRGATVGASATHDVGQSYQVAIKGDQTLTVGADQTVDVQTDDLTGVKGARVEIIGASETSAIGANRRVCVRGAYSEGVGALYGLQCNQANVEVEGTFAQSVGLALVHVAGSGTSESVAGARAEVVGAVRSLTATEDYGESVRGAKSVTAGACRAKAGAVVTTTTKGAQRTVVGGATSIDATGIAAFKANQIEITAASLDAGALKLLGGALKIKKGAAKLDGTIKRRGGSKIG